MIEAVQITPAPKTLLTQKMNVYKSAYKGTGLCRLFRSEGAYVMIFNANAVVVGECDEELLNFMRFLGVVTIESEIPVTCDGVSCKAVHYLRRGRVAPNDIAPISDGNLDELQHIITSAFPKIDFSLWYCDYSHLRRRGLSEGYLYNGSFVRIDNFLNSYVITAAASAPESRGKGNMRRLLSAIPIPLITVSEEDTLGFYLKCGFEQTGGAYLSTINDQ